MPDANGSDSLEGSDDDLFSGFGFSFGGAVVTSALATDPMDPVEAAAYAATHPYPVANVIVSYDVNGNVVTHNTGLHQGVLTSYDADGNLVERYVDLDPPASAPPVDDAPVDSMTHNSVFLAMPGQADVSGGEGDDTIQGASSGSANLSGGDANDRVTAYHGDNLIAGNVGNDTLSAGDGQDVLRGGQGDDLIVGGAGHDFISGDRGNDTETGGTGPDIFHGSQNLGLDEVTNFSYAKGDRVELDPGTTYTISQVGPDTVIDMGGGNQMVLENVQFSSLHSDWLFVGTLTHV